MHNSVIPLHSCNKSQSHMYLEFAFLPEECKQGTTSTTHKNMCQKFPAVWES